MAPEIQIHQDSLPSYENGKNDHAIPYPQPFSFQNQTGPLIGHRESSPSSSRSPSSSSPPGSSSMSRSHSRDVSGMSKVTASKDDAESAGGSRTMNSRDSGISQSRNVTPSTLVLNLSLSEHPSPEVKIFQGLPSNDDKLSFSRRSSTTDSGTIVEASELQPLIPPEEEKWYKGPLRGAAIRLSILFVVFTTIVVGTFYYGLPKVDEVDKPLLHIPKSFADLQALNGLFQKYKNLYPYRIVACGVVSYLYVQTFSLPGSMYISILFGAAYGILIGLLLSCLCDSFGSLLCYTLSSFLAPPLLKLPFYRARIETWRIKIMGDPRSGKQVSWDGVFAFLIVLRIAPLPPHWIANFVAPHLGIGMGLFWLSCFIGIAPISIIHVTIGSSLDSMTSAADFHLLSLRNILGLAAVIVAVLIPVGLKRVFRKDLGELGEAEAALEESRTNGDVVHVPYVGAGLGDEESELGNETETEGRTYQAVDSGVVLSIPSSGDGSMDSRKGKSRALRDDEGMESESESITVNSVRVLKEDQAIKGYGSIETPGAGDQVEKKKTWWSRLRR